MTICNPETCKICKKEGLSILPLRYGVVPAYNQDGGVNKMPDLPGELGAQVTDKRLTQHNYALRVLRQGYIYMLRCDVDQSKEWFGWEVTSDGYCIPFDPIDGPVPGEPRGPMKCSNQAKNLPGTMISVKDPEKASLVYLMFSGHPLTKKILKAHQAGDDNALSMRMQFFSPLAFMLSKGVGPGGTNTVKIDEIDKYTIDYNKDYFRFLSYHDKVTGVHEDHALYGLNPRHYMAPELIKRFAKPGGPYGIAMALWDPVGITAELNDARNKKSARAALVAGLGNEKRAHERIIADTIDGIRINAEANPGPFWNRHFGPERFLKHIDQKKWEGVCKVNQNFEKIKTAVIEISEDYVKWKESDNWKWVARHDFDGADPRSGLNCEKMVADSVCGSGVTKHERDEVWGKIWPLSNTDPDNWLARGMAALHLDFQSYFDANKNWYREYDSVKGTLFMVKELGVDHLPKLMELHGKIRTQRAANNATGTIIETLAGIMMHLSIENNDAYQKIMQSVAKTLIIRADVIPKPVAVRGTAAQIEKQVFEVAVGKARTAPPLKIETNVPVNRTAYKATEGNLGKRGLQLSQAVQGAVVLRAPVGKEQTREVAAWVVTRVQSGVRALKSEDMKALSLTTVDLSGTAANGGLRNPFVENQLKRSGAAADGVLGAGAFFFQMWTFGMMLTGFIKAAEKKDPNIRTKEEIEFGESMLTAVLSAASALFETGAAYGVLSGASAEKLAFRVTWAARLSGWASVIDGVYLVVKGGYRFLKGSKEDRECALWTMGSGLFLIGAGFATWKLGSISVAAVLAESSAAVAGTAVALGGAVEVGTAAGAAEVGAAVLGGPIVWTMIVVSLVGVAMYMSWQAMVTDSEILLPVEYWMDSCVFGLRKHVKDEAAESLAFFDEEEKRIPPFPSLAKELEALQSTYLTVTGKLNTVHGFGTVEVFYEVAAPHFVAGAVLVLEFFVKDKGKSFLVKNLVLTHDDKAAKAITTEWHEKHSVVRNDPARTKLDLNGMALTEGSFLMVQRSLGQTKDVPGRTYAGQLELKAAYLPDSKQHPQLKTTFTEKTY